RIHCLCYNYVYAKKIFQIHFDVGADSLESVEDVLLKLKKLAHQRVYGDREFGHDAAEDSKKPVAISVEQPTVAKAVSPYLFEGDIFLSKKQAINILKEASNIPANTNNKGREDVPLMRVQSRNGPSLRPSSTASMKAL
ncbi:hypothetical protein OESDEN_21599, partial [Oesophagostomum dentatum]